MKIEQCEKNGVNGWRAGPNGTCHVGAEAFQRAKRDEMKAKAQEWRENPRPLVEEADEAEEATN